MLAGGVRVPFVISWPDGLAWDADDNGVRRQFSHVTDIVPTLLDLAGLESPTHRHGRPAQERDGVSIAEFLRNPSAQSGHTEQYAEFGGHRGFYRDGWKLVSLHRDPAAVDDPDWELYDVTNDPAETRDLAATHPTRSPNWRMPGMRQRGTTRCSRCSTRRPPSPAAGPRKSA